MKPSLRQLLADSHVAAVAIAVLLFWSVQWGVQALWVPLFRAIDFLMTAIVTREIPYFSVSLADCLIRLNTFFYLFYALISFAIAWVLSRWVYRNGPLRSLSTYRIRLKRSNHV